jgi:hypothetical protein
MSETTEGTPAPEPEPTPTSAPAPEPTPTPEPEAPEQTPEDEQKAARDKEDRRIAQLRARLGAAEREREAQREELEFYRRQAQQMAPAEETPEQRYHRERAEIRREVEAQIRKDNFHAQGEAAYGDWRQRCDDLMKMGADPDLAQLLVEMPDGVRVAASLASDPDALERIAALRTERARAVALGKYAATVEDTPPSRLASAPRQISAAPAPVRPVTGRANPQVNEYRLTGQQLVEKYSREAMEARRSR